MNCAETYDLTQDAKRLLREAIQDWNDGDDLGCLEKVKLALSTLEDISKAGEQN